jgi:putative Mg2+ transporter-C (MgtC) family protein
VSERLVGDQGWHPIAELALAILLCSLIGLEREWRHKQAGLRTHTLVGVAAALFVIVSKYGFNDVLGTNVAVDPSRVAAQIVSGIGFIGGGLIFVRGDAVRGLTTAAIIWMTAAVGMACGAGLTAVAVLATACHFLVVLVYPVLLATLSRSGYAGLGLCVHYAAGRGTLAKIIAEVTDRGFVIVRVATQQLDHDANGAAVVAVTLELRGRPNTAPLAIALSDLDGVSAVVATDHSRNGE